MDSLYQIISSFPSFMVAVAATLRHRRTPLHHRSTASFEDFIRPMSSCVNFLHTRVLRPQGED